MVRYFYFILFLVALSFVFPSFVLAATCSGTASTVVTAPCGGADVWNAGSGSLGAGSMCGTEKTVITSGPCHMNGSNCVGTMQSYQFCQAGATNSCVNKWAPNSDPAGQFDVACAGSGGSCGGTRGSCSGSCPSGQTCRAPAIAGNGDACSCHGSGGGQVCTGWVNGCRKSVAAGGTGCSGNNIQSGSGCSGCKSTQVCCQQRTCYSITNPVGALGAFSCAATNITGWSCDGSNFGVGITVRFYDDASLGANYYLGEDLANKAGTATIAANCGGYPNHKFSFMLPNYLRDGQTHKIYAEAVDILGGDNVVLNGSPVAINCPPAVTTPACTGVTPADTPVISSVSNTYTVYATGVTNTDSVDFSVGSQVSGTVQHVYAGVNQGGGTWAATIDFNAYHNDDVGYYNVDVSLNGDSVVPCGSADFTRDTAPTFTSLNIRNGSGAMVAWDGGNRNQICKPDFANDPDNRTATFEAVITDVDGGNDVAAVNLNWNGNIYPMTLSNPTPTTITATATIDYFTGASTTAPITIQYNDQTGFGTGAAYVATGYTWKVWNCNVPTNGNLYDGSNAPFGVPQCSTGAGFTTLATAAMNFNAVSAGAATITNSNAYSLNTPLQWANTYTMLPNADLVAGSPTVRWVDPNVGTPLCGAQYAVSTLVDPYEANPALKVDFSAVKNQQAWYSVRGGGIKAAGAITDMVPITCAVSGSCTPAISAESSFGAADNGLVAGSSVSNNSGCAMDGSQCVYGSPGNWYKNSNVLSSADKFNYQYFYDKYFSALGLGYTLPGDSTMSTVNAMGGQGVFLVGGDFNVDVNNAVAPGNFLMIIVKGKITFDSSVTQTAGVLAADGGIFATGVSPTQLVIQGMLYSAQSGGDIGLTRGYSAVIANNTSPAVLVTYRPDLLFNMPGSLMSVLLGWR